jgi:hypothetical protein
MRRSFFVIVLAVAACGGKQKSTTPPPPLPEPKAEAKPEPPKEEVAEAPKEPPVPQGPLAMTITAPKVTVKLINAGKGKKVALKHTSKAGDKQAVEIALDFAGKQVAAPEHGGTIDQIAPTVVLLADAEAKEVATDGATKFNLTISGVDARDKAGAVSTATDFKTELASLTGATIEGAVNANGQVSDLTLRVQKPDKYTIQVLGMVKLSLMPMWPVLPTEAIAPGAKWQVSATTKLADRLDVTHITDYELIAKKGKVWTIKGTTKVTGADQDVGDGAKMGGIAGTGSAEATVNEGTLVPTNKQSLKTDFTASGTDPQQNKTISIAFHLEQENAVTPTKR